MALYFYKWRLILSLLGASVDSAKAEALEARIAHLEAELAANVLKTLALEATLAQYVAYKSNVEN